mmetsp:Transcript_38080/g.97330  ORF Transcript_38080/g.97330 Transcript_38080/m.97330 type:complete len:272 (+) Transcript_38080:79-894(+)
MVTMMRRGAIWDQPPPPLPSASPSPAPLFPSPDAPAHCWKISFSTSPPGAGAGGALARSSRSLRWGEAPADPGGAVGAPGRRLFPSRIDGRGECVTPSTLHTISGSSPARGAGGRPPASHSAPSSPSPPSPGPRGMESQASRTGRPWSSQPTLSRSAGTLPWGAGALAGREALSVAGLSEGGLAMGGGLGRERAEGTRQGASEEREAAMRASIDWRLWMASLSSWDPVLLPAGSAGFAMTTGGVAGRVTASMSLCARFRRLRDSFASRLAS